MTSTRILLACTLSSLAAFVACDGDDSSGTNNGGSTSSSSGGSSGASSSGGSSSGATSSSGDPGDPFTPIAGEPGTVWLTSNPDDVLMKVDAQDGKVLASYPVGEEPSAVAAIGGFTYLKNNDGSSFVIGRVDAQGTLTQTAVKGPDSLTVGAGSLWASLSFGGVSRIDPATGNETKAISLPSLTAVPGPITFMNDTVYVLASTKIVKIPAATDTAADLVDLKTGYPTIQSALTPMAAGEGAVWPLVYTGGVADGKRVLAKVNPTTGEILGKLDFAINDAADGVAAGGGSVWVTDAANGKLHQVDPTTITIKKTIDLGGGGSDGPSEMAISPTAVWISDYKNDRAIRVAFATGTPQIVKLPHGPSKIAFETK
jgi:hypothetical protein